MYKEQVKEQTEIDFDSQDENTEQISCEQYLYQAIATNFEDLSDSEIVHFYNQRTEDSENRIKELKMTLVQDRCLVLILMPMP